MIHMPPVTKTITGRDAAEAFSESAAPSASTTVSPKNAQTVREEQVEPVPGVGAVPHVARDAAVRVVAPRDAEERGAQDRGESEEAGELE